MYEALALPMPLIARTDPADATTTPTARPVDAAAFGQLLEREGSVLLAAARAILLDEAEAQDLVQATFELAWRHRDQLRESGAIRGWLLTIQAREAFRWRRRLARFVRLDGVFDDTSPPNLSTADTLVIRDALRALPPRMRAAIVLHHMAGLSVPQVANALGVSPNTVKTQLRIGLARLRGLLGDD